MSVGGGLIFLIFFTTLTRSIFYSDLDLLARLLRHGTLLVQLAALSRRLRHLLSSFEPPLAVLDLLSNLVSPACPLSRL